MGLKWQSEFCSYQPHCQFQNPTVGLARQYALRFPENKTMSHHTPQTKWLAAILAIALVTAFSATLTGALPPSLRLYVFDCGQLNYTSAEAYQLKRDEVANTDMSIACYLIAHPKGTLMWDVGAIKDDSWKPTGAPVRLHFALPDLTERDVTVTKTLKSQLAEVGYKASGVNYLAFSHYHWDHTANANDFSGATWIVRKSEHDLMFSGSTERTIPSLYSKLAKSKKVLLQGDADHDVFGDGKVVIMSSPGHSIGHQVLFLDLAKTGRVVLAGDLYHYPEERTLNRIPPRDFNTQQTAASRAALEIVLKNRGATLWIQHDAVANAKLRKSPEYYE
jgi:N-acyl homoserine lactone hydrolase